jgi:proline dehydrogenase
MLNSPKNSDLQNWLRMCWLPLIKRAARTYVVGPELPHALLLSDRLAKLGFATTLGFRNRAEDSPQQTADAYCSALAAVAPAQQHCYFSVKAPALHFAPELIAQVLRHGQQYGIRIHFDALGPETADPTFALIAAALPQRVQLSCTLPGRWQRSQYDADWAVKRGVAVRVVKGEWSEGMTGEPDLRAGFLTVVDRLAGRARHVAVATHDAQLAREALQRLRATNTSCELEVLVGFPVRAVLRVAGKMRVPVRFYVSYGDAWPPYRLSQIKQNPRVGWWFCRDLLFGRALRMPHPFSLHLPQRNVRPCVTHPG